MTRQRVDLLTVMGLGMLLMPLLTMWHEIGGHAAACAAQGGRVTAIGAFYVDCHGLSGMPRVAVALAGAVIDAIVAGIAYVLWRRATHDMARLVLWLVWVSKAFVAAGYLCFSGATGVGDLGPGVAGGIGPLPAPWLWRGAEVAIGVALYVLLVRAAIGALTAMLGDSTVTGAARRRIAHGFYATVGVSALLVGLLNPVGPFITILSAAASSFGGNAGFISIGFARPAGSDALPFAIDRRWNLIAAGVLVLTAFAVVLGPTLRFI